MCVYLHGSSVCQIGGLSRQITSGQHSSTGEKFIGAKDKRGEGMKKKKEREKRSEDAAFYLDCDITAQAATRR